jgi:hypothetical protein
MRPLDFRYAIYEGLGAVGIKGMSLPQSACGAGKQRRIRPAPGGTGRDIVHQPPGFACGHWRDLVLLVMADAFPPGWKPRLYGRQHPSRNNNCGRFQRFPINSNHFLKIYENKHQ